MTINLPRLSGSITATGDAPSQHFLQWWNDVCTQVESNLNDLAAQQAQIDSVLGIANGAASTAAAAQGSAEYAIQFGGSITPLTPIASGDVLANTTGASALPIGNTLSALLDFVLGSAQGAIIFRGTAGWKVLAPGTAGQKLTTGGTAADVSWT
jgi:hypothetical protein